MIEGARQVQSPGGGQTDSRDLQERVAKLELAQSYERLITNDKISSLNLTILHQGSQIRDLERRQNTPPPPIDYAVWLKLILAMAIPILAFAAVFMATGSLRDAIQAAGHSGKMLGGP